MNQERNFGVTEAGLGLTVITCLLVALGFWIVQRLVGAGAAPPVEVRPPTAKADPSPGAEPVAKKQKPQVLVPQPLEPAEAESPHTAHRPQWLSYEEEADESPMPGIDGVLTPLPPDASQSLWPPLETDSQQEQLWPEPLQVR